MRPSGRVHPISALMTILLAVLFVSPSVFGQTTGTDIVIGKRISLPSKVLNTDMPISVYLPANYEAGNIKYPVLYDLNGFAYFTYAAGTVELLARNIEIPDMIVIGLPNLQNGYVPTPYEIRGPEPTAADLSLKFFSDELMPYIDKRSTGPQDTTSCPGTPWRACSRCMRFLRGPRCFPPGSPAAPGSRLIINTG